ncbi:MAG: hypothetical protein GC192_21310 [Bacteroidetes bacterium]|nr:hypothetical protein [Bacteroidota bacterium]
MKSVFNASSAEDGLQGSQKAQLDTADKEGSKTQALLRDSTDNEGYSLKTGAGSKTQLSDIKNNVEKKKWQKFVYYLLLRQAIEKALARVQEIIEFHQTQMEVLAEIIRDARFKLMELDEQGKALMAELKRFRETGRFDLDGNGKLKNARAKEAIAAWEEKTGVRLDLTSPSSYLGVLEAAKDIEIQQAEIKAGIEKDERDYQYHKAKRDEAIEIKKDLESGDPERCRQALERLDSLGNIQRLGTAENSLTSETEIDNKQKQEILSQMELTNRDLAQDGFTFNFPPLQSEFNRSVINDGKNLTSKKPENIELKTTPSGPSMR